MRVETGVGIGCCEDVHLNERCPVYMNKLQSAITFDLLTGEMTDIDYLITAVRCITQQVNTVCKFDVLQVGKISQCKDVISFE